MSGTMDLIGERSGTIAIRLPLDVGYVVEIDGKDYAAFSDAASLCAWLLRTLEAVEPAHLPRMLSSADSDSPPAPRDPPRSKITRLFGG